MPAFVRAHSGKIHVIDEDHPKGLCGTMGSVGDVMKSMEWYRGNTLRDLKDLQDLCARCAWVGVRYERHTAVSRCVTCGRECAPTGHTHATVRKTLDGRPRL